MVEPQFEHSQFGSWYPGLKEFVPKVRVLDAPEEFRTYLLSDGIVLHGGNDPSDSDSEWETADVPPKDATADDNGSIDSDGGAASPPSEFHMKIEQAIRDLHGEVAPKLNWSAPVDSTWINPGNTMRCTSANDIYMLLKSSDYINHDLQLNPAKITLVLREWYDVHPSTEFRCFVRDHQLVGISQRDMNYYEFLEAARPDIERLARNMADEVCKRYPDRSFVFDIHIPNSWEKAWLVDINPWHEKTDSLLFGWDELPEIIELETRLVEKEDRSRTFSSKPHSTSHVPYDLVDCEKGTFEDILVQMKEQRRQEHKEK